MSPRDFNQKLQKLYEDKKSGKKLKEELSYLSAD